MKFVYISALALLVGMVAAAPTAQEKRQTYAAFVLFIIYCSFFCFVAYSHFSRYREGRDESQNEKRQTYAAFVIYLLFLFSQHTHMLAGTARAETNPRMRSARRMPRS